ncbi:MAG: flagellar biosynthetic protein FliR, partial [Candidatus Sericytochromatia bacterium]
RMKIGLAFALALILAPFLMNQPLTFDYTNMWTLGLAVLQEIALGVFIGMMAQFLFVAVQFAGQVVGLQMGFGMASVFDPNTHAQVSIVAQIYLYMILMVFLLMDGHHWLLIALQRSFDTVPLGTFTVDGQVMGVLLAASNELFWVALTIMAPVLGVLVLAELAMGIVARIMPQMNVFVASFPVKIALGFITMILAFPLMIAYLGPTIERNFLGILRFLAS